MCISAFDCALMWMAVASTIAPFVVLFAALVVRPYFYRLGKRHGKL